MGTFTDKRIIDELIANNGFLYGDPQVARIVEYENFVGETCWGVVYSIEPEATWLRYDFPTRYISNPRVIFVPTNKEAE